MLFIKHYLHLQLNSRTELQLSVGISRFEMSGKCSALIKYYYWENRHKTFWMESSPSFKLPQGQPNRSKQLGRAETPYHFLGICERLERRKRKMSGLTNLSIISPTQTKVSVSKKFVFLLETQRDDKQSFRVEGTENRDGKNGYMISTFFSESFLR